MCISIWTMRVTSRDIGSPAFGGVQYANVMWQALTQWRGIQTGKRNGGSRNKVQVAAEEGLLELRIGSTEAEMLPQSGRLWLQQVERRESPFLGKALGSVCFGSASKDPASPAYAALHGRRQRLAKVS